MSLKTKQHVFRSFKLESWPCLVICELYEKENISAFKPYAVNYVILVLSLLEIVWVIFFFQTFTWSYLFLSVFFVFVQLLHMCLYNCGSKQTMRKGLWTRCIVSTKIIPFHSELIIISLAGIWTCVLPVRSS